MNTARKTVSLIKVKFLMAGSLSRAKKLKLVTSATPILKSDLAGVLNIYAIDVVLKRVKINIITALSKTMVEIFIVAPLFPIQKPSKKTFHKRTFPLKS